MHHKQTSGAHKFFHWLTKVLETNSSASICTNQISTMYHTGIINPEMLRLKCQNHATQANVGRTKTPPKAYQNIQGNHSRRSLATFTCAQWSLVPRQSSLPTRSMFTSYPSINEQTRKDAIDMQFRTPARHTAMGMTCID